MTTIDFGTAIERIKTYPIPKIPRNAKGIGINELLNYCDLLDEFEKLGIKKKVTVEYISPSMSRDFFKKSNLPYKDRSIALIAKDIIVDQIRTEYLKLSEDMRDDYIRSLPDEVLENIARLLKGCE